jgi:cellulose synthase/poly-beta-1,6-N-acetylglucosamine synthase-like glycosyltransferase
MNYPTVSVIIPVRNESRFITTLLDHCIAQDYPSDKLEILLADGMSDDGTRDKIQQFIEAHNADDIPKIRVVDNPEFIVPTGLNRAIKGSKSDVIVCMGAHAKYESNYISECVRIKNETSAENVGGPTHAIAEGYMARVVAASYNSPFSVGGAKFHDLDYEGFVDTVTFGCWSREYLLSIDGYDEEFVRNQDDEMNLRTTLSGGKIYQSPSIKSYYYPRDSMSKLFKQQLQYGYWKVRVIQKHKRPASVRHIIPIIFVLGLLVGGILSLLFPLLAVIYLITLAFYVLLSIGFSAKAAAKRGFDLFPVLPIVFFIYHVAYGTGFFVGVLDFYVTSKKAGRLFGSTFRSMSR